MRELTTFEMFLMDYCNIGATQAMMLADLLDARYAKVDHEHEEETAE